ncbi:MAG: type IV pilus assembly protein PilM [Candidatus Bipolaricaulia bacterium]
MAFSEWISKLGGNVKHNTAIDIEGSSLKLVQLKYTREQRKLINFDIERLETGGLEGAEIADEAQVIGALRELKQRNGLRDGEEVISCLPGEKVTVRYTLVPNMSDKDIREAARWIFQDELPFSIEDVEKNYLRAGTSADADGVEKVKVLIVASPKEFVWKWIELFDAAGLRMGPLDAQPFCLMNLLEGRLRRNARTIIVRLGQQSSDMGILDGDQIQFTRNISVGWDDLIERAVTQYNLPIGDARKRLADLAARYPLQEATEDSQEEGIQNLITSFIEKLVWEIQRSTRFYYDESPSGGEISKVFLTGPGCSINGIEEEFGQRLELSAEEISALESVDLSSLDDVRRERLKVQARDYTTAISLAMRDM